MRFMIVDDSDADIYLARLAIESYDANIEVVTARDGEEALEMLNAADAPPDLIFLDINMPVMNGHEFLAAYEAQPSKSSTVVMLSSSSDEREKQKCRAFDFVIEFLTKPLEAGDVEVLLKRQGLV